MVLCRSVVVTLALVILCGSVQLACADECEDLSYRRNRIYKLSGYCFKTPAQIRIFGNAGCRFDRQSDVPLSANDNSEISAIIGEERALGCR